MSRGRRVAIDGRLNWREWETTEGSKRQAVEIVAESVQFLEVAATKVAPAGPPMTRAHLRTPSTATERRGA